MTPSPARARGLLLALACAAACSWVDFSGSHYACDDGGNSPCPDGYACLGGFCVSGGGSQSTTTTTSGSSFTGGTATAASSTSSGGCGSGLPTLSPDGGCGQLCESCTLTSCCAGLSCEVSASYVCFGTTGTRCASGADCVSHSCQGGACACAAFQTECVNTGDCCPGLVCSSAECLVPPGGQCSAPGACSTGQCSAQGQCLCLSTGLDCQADGDCCNGSCSLNPSSGLSTCN